MILIAMMFVLLMYALLSACIIYAGGKAASWLGYNPAIAKKRIKILWFAPVIIWLVWDLPTIPLHKYYCATQAGFFVYKTPEQWLKEHPEVTREELRFVGGMDNQGRYRPLYAPIDKSLWDEGKRYRAKVEWVSWFNSRIYQNGRLKKITFFPIRKHIFQFEDVSTGEVLAESIYFSSGYAPAMTTGGIRGFKGWLKSSGCGIGIGDAAQYKKQLQILGDKYD